MKITTFGQLPVGSRFIIPTEADEPHIKGEMFCDLQGLEYNSMGLYTARISQVPDDAEILDMEFIPPVFGLAEIKENMGQFIKTMKAINQ